MAATLQAGTPLAEQLSSIVQPKLVDIGWSSGGLDDSALAEYIILMLVNGKTQDQIASELSNDLLNLGPEDSGAQDFARWLFEQVNLLMAQANGEVPDTTPGQDQTQAIPSFTTQDFDRRGRQPGEVAQDAEMGDAMDTLANVDIPTGPKSMRQAPRPGGRRLIGQLNRAMDRSNDSVLHRVRPQSGERVNTHRQPPRGPRGAGPQNRPLNNGVPSGPKGPNMNRNQPAMNQGFSQQQQMQLFTLLSQMMATPVNGMPGMPAPVINPNFKRQNQGSGKSLAERVDRPLRNGAPNHGKPHANGHKHHTQHIQQDSEMTEDTAMEGTENSQRSETGAEATCKYNLKCTRADCMFAHQSSTAPPGTAIDPRDHCPFGADCQNRKCTARHPSPAQKKGNAGPNDQDCKFFPNCTNPHCQFRHPTMPLCRNGADCKTEGCKFTHVQTKCKYNPCLNVTCPYKHEEGQKRGKFGDMVWTADGAKAKEGHVSERKFVSEDGGEEELIVPGDDVQDTDVVT